MKNGLTQVKNNRTGMFEMASSESLKLLANAIIEQACLDYVKWEFARSRPDIEKFLLSDYGKLLLRDAVEPAIIIQYLRTQVKEVKTWPGDI